MAFKIIAAVVFGALIGLDRHIAGKPVAPMQNILVSLFGLFVGGVWRAFYSHSGSGIEFAGEVLAGFGLFALVFRELIDAQATDATTEKPEWEFAVVRFLDPAPAFALGVACAFSAWTSALVFLALKVAVHAWRMARPAIFSWRNSHAAPPRPGASADATNSRRALNAAGVEWLAGDPPPAFAEVLRSAEAEPIRRTAKNFPEHRQTTAAHNAAGFLDARSAATPRPIGRGNERVEQYKIQI